MPGGKRGAAPTTAAAPAAEPAINAAVETAPLEPRHRGEVQALLLATGFFRASEVAIALEVLDSFFTTPDHDYSALGAFTPGGQLIGYVCFGPTPCTTGTWDVYWIAVAPGAQDAGVGTTLLQEVERRLVHMDARLVVIETSSQPLYQPTRSFYERRGYAEVARVPDFYADGDDRVIFAKRIQPNDRRANNGQMAGHPETESDDGRRSGRTLRRGKYRP
jgi:ribosomal protein S18 acetylase RimI-like enzyme